MFPRLYDQNTIYMMQGQIHVWKLDFIDPPTDTITTYVENYPCKAKRFELQSHVSSITHKRTHWDVQGESLARVAALNWRVLFHDSIILNLKILYISFYTKITPIAFLLWGAYPRVTLRWIVGRQELLSNQK